MAEPRAQGYRSAVVAHCATWVAFAVALALALPQPPNVTQWAIGAAVGTVLIVAGFRAASRVRPIAPSRWSPPMLAGISIFAGAAMGAVLLGFLVALAEAEPALRVRFAGRLSEPLWRPWALAFESSILEEVMFRLFAMSVVGWVVADVLKRPAAAFPSALIVSTLFFGAAHLPAWLALAAPSVALVAAVMALNGTGGVLFGWIFWRWGLPFAILCHAAADVVVQTFAPRLLA